MPGGMTNRQRKTSNGCRGDSWDLITSSLINHSKMDDINHPKLDVPFKFIKSFKMDDINHPKLDFPFKFYKSSKNGWHKSSKIGCCVA